MNLKLLNFQLPIQNLIIAYPLYSNYLLIAQASRKKRKWTVRNVEKISTENSLEFFTHIKNPKKTAILGILPRKSYFFIRSVYPPGLKKNLINILNYDREENVLLKNDCLYMVSKPLEDETGILAPSLSLKKSDHEKLAQLFNIHFFGKHLMIPDVYLIEAFIKSRHGDLSKGNTWVLQEYNRNSIAAFQSYQSIITESVITRWENSGSLSLLQQKLREASDITYISDATEIPQGFNLKKEISSVDSLSFFREAVTNLLRKQNLTGFEGTIRLNYPKIPKTLYIPIIGLLLVVATGLYAQTLVNRSRDQLNSLIARKNILERKWAPIEKQMQAIEKLEQDKNTLQNTLKQGIPTLQVLEALTKVTPNDTWLNYLVVTQNNTIILRGESSSAVKYVSALSKIPGFKNVTFASPVRKNTRTGKEYFNIRLSVDWNQFIKGFSRETGQK